MQHHYIQEQQALVALCSRFSNSEYLAVDTEFVRTRTYYPNLGLLQVCNGEELALIDPLALQDLSPFWQLMQNPDITKVLHACSEDLEVFARAGSRPQNLIDSQILMAFLGHGISMGYAAMIEHFTGVALDKSESRTDWLQRPLSEKQLDYAAADVEHLYAIYPGLLAQIQQKQLWPAVQQECQALVNKKFSATDENELYLNVKASWRLQPAQLNRLKHLAIWRYRLALQRNLPLGFVAKDHTLLAVAERNPASVGAMAQLAGVEILDVRHQGKAMMAVLRQASQDPAADYPAKLLRLEQLNSYKQLFKKVKNYLVSVAEQQQLPVEMLASKKQINQLLSWHLKINGAGQQSENVDLLQGWRGQMLAQPLRQLLND